MKKVLLFMVCIYCASTMFGQLKVNSSGDVNVSNGLVADGIIGGSSAVLSVKSNRIDPKYNSTFDYLSLQLIRTASISSSCVPFINYLLSSSNPNPSPSNITFYVTGGGQTYSKLGIIQSSDSICKENISSLSSSLDKIKSLRGVTFDYKPEAMEGENTTTRSTQPASALPDGINNEIGDDSPTGIISSEILQQIEAEKSRKRIGLIAQEVEQIIPEVVRTLPDGSKGIMYGDLVSVLVEGMKELQDSIGNLQQQINEIKAMLSAPAPQNLSRQSNDRNPSANGVQGQKPAELYQNTPNPFNQETEISYRLSDNAINAAICIYNLNGQQLKKYVLSSNFLTGKITVSASEFTPGMYIYSLVINNQMVDSKRMTLTD